MKLWGWVVTGIWGSAFDLYVVTVNSAAVNIIYFSHMNPPARTTEAFKQVRSFDR